MYSSSDKQPTVLSAECNNAAPPSLRALDAMVFFLADVQDGLGPFLAIYLLQIAHWDHASVGIAMASIVLGTLVAQIPAGAVIDHTRCKRTAVVISSAVVAVCSIVMVLWPVVPIVAATQALTGAAAAVMPPAIAGISLGLVGRARMARRTSRNEAMNHAGNVFAAVAAGAVGTLFGYGTIFFLVAAMAVASALSALLIDPAAINHEMARGSDKQTDGHVVSVRTLFADRRLLNFLLAMFLFHFANAAMLPLVGQKVSDGQPAAAAALMSACIVAAQVVMVPVAIAAGWAANAWGCRPLFMIGFVVLPLRGLAYILSTNPIYLVAVQLLDGIGAGIYGVASVIEIVEITRGTGRFNLALGALATFAGLGAATSNLVVGFITQAAGYDAGFLFLAAVAVCGLVFYFFTAVERSAVQQTSCGTLPDAN